MESRVEAARERHARGFNCAQAVACAYADQVGLDEKTLFAVCEGLGRGMGGMEGTCGAISGACVLAGLLSSDGDIRNPKTKGSTYRLSKELLERFGSMNGSTVCRELKGIGTGKPLRSCDGCVADATEIAGEVLFSDR